MKTHFKRAIYRGLLGITIGGLISATVYFILSFQGESITISAELIRQQYLASLIIGFYCAAISIVFDIEEWSLLRQTITHGILMLPYFPLAHYVGWMPNNLVGRSIFVVLFVIFYVAFWLGFKIYWTNKAKQLSQEVERVNDNE